MPLRRRLLQELASIETDPDDAQHRRPILRGLLKSLLELLLEIAIAKLAPYLISSED